MLTFVEEEKQVSSLVKAESCPKHFICVKYTNKALKTYSDSAEIREMQIKEALDNCQTGDQLQIVGQGLGIKTAVTWLVETSLVQPTSGTLRGRSSQFTGMPVIQRILLWVCSP